MTYPPSYSDSIKLFDELKLLDAKASSDPNPRKYELIHDLAEGHFMEARPYFLAGLDHWDPEYRWACINALAMHWRDTDPYFIARLLDFSERDPDSQVRLSSIFSLGWMKVPSTLPVLKRIVENEQVSAFLRQLAYEAILKILNYSPEQFPAWIDPLDVSLIDKDLLRQISNTSGTRD